MERAGVTVLIFHVHHYSYCLLSRPLSSCFSGWQWYMSCKHMNRLITLSLASAGFIININLVLCGREWCFYASRHAVEVLPRVSMDCTCRSSHVPGSTLQSFLAGLRTRVLYLLFRALCETWNIESANFWLHFQAWGGIPELGAVFILLLLFPSEMECHFAMACSTLTTNKRMCERLFF